MTEEEVRSPISRAWTGRAANKSIRARARDRGRIILFMCIVTSFLRDFETGFDALKRAPLLFSGAPYCCDPEIRQIYILIIAPEVKYWNRL